MSDLRERTPNGSPTPAGLKPGERRVLAEIVAMSPGAMAVLDGPEHRYGLFNRSYSAIAKGKGELAGRALAEVWPESAAAIVPVLDRVFVTGEPYTARDAPFEVERDRGRETIWLTFSFLPIRDESGAVQSILITVNEVTETVHARAAAEEATKRLRASEERVRVMADETPEIIWVTDADGRLEFVNRAYSEFFGTTLDRLHGTGWGALVHPEDVAGYAAGFELALRTRSEFLAKVRVRRADGEWRWLDSRGRPRFAADGTFLGIAATSPDVTERELAESALRASKKQLHERTAALEQALMAHEQSEEALRASVERERTARQGAERAGRFSDMFVGMLGHDLRNPLSAIMTGAELLSRLSSSERQSRMATRVIASADRMSGMIDQLLDLTRIRIGDGIAVRRQPKDLAELVEQTVGEIENVSPETAISVERIGDAHGEWDGDRLLQVLSNLIGNAARHGHDGRVRLQIDGASPDEVRFVVRNAGVITPDVVPLVFDPFRRGHETSGGRRGLGLGLYITREIVAAHAGTVSVTSSEEQGTAFEVRLPRRPLARPETSEVSA